MDNKVFKKGQELTWERQSAESELARVREVLADFDGFRSNITFQRENKKPGHSSLSFGSKKFKFKQQLRALLEALEADLVQQVADLQAQFDAL